MRGGRLSPLVVLVALAAVLLLRELRPGEDPDASLPEAGASAGASLDGTVARVHDGDTVTLRGAFGETRVRLGQIDAPELGQRWGEEAHDALRQLAGGQTARLDVLDIDDYGRHVGNLYVDDRFVNEALVRSGHAWAYRRWVRDPGIVTAEEDARREGRGLWSLPKPDRQPPWDWRRSHRRR